MKKPIQPLQDLALSIVRWAQRHPRRITAAAAALLLGTTGGAFAVASFAPDASDLPVRQVVESLRIPAPVAETLEEQALRLYRTDTTRSTDTAEALLQRLGVVDEAAAEFLRTDGTSRKALLGRAGRTVSAEVSDSAGLLKLTTRWIQGDDDAAFQRLVVERQPDGRFASRIEGGALTVSTRLTGGIIQSSLFAATDEERIPDHVAIQLAEIFSGHIDFHTALRKGDRFSVVYETLEADGEPLRAGRVLSAEFVNAGTRYQAMWFRENGRNGAYYTLDGQRMQRAYLASPLEFSRVTSGFAMRMHPILQTWRQHLGVDYGAPTGTPVRSVGDGVVEFAGRQGGFGNVIYLRHRNQHTTVYAHLSRIDVRQGQSVSQGQTIGAVGATGWATGPHLHFEFRVNGIHQDPTVMARQSEALPLAASARPAFDRAAAEVRMQLAAAAVFQPSRVQ